MYVFPSIQCESLLPVLGICQWAGSCKIQYPGTHAHTVYIHLSISQWAGSRHCECPSCALKKLKFLNVFTHLHAQAHADTHTHRHLSSEYIQSLILLPKKDWKYCLMLKNSGCQRRKRKQLLANILMWSLECNPYIWIHGHVFFVLLPARHCSRLFGD